MRAIAEFSVTPIGVGVSLSPYVAECERILQEWGIKHTLHENGTNLEGELADIMSIVEECQYRLHGMGVPRVQTLLKITTRTDRDQKMEDKVKSVKEKLAEG